MAETMTTINPLTAVTGADALLKIQEAFDVFRMQSERLQASYDDLKENLATANRRLNAKNRALSSKVEELRQMSLRLHWILESLTDGVLVVSPHLKVERCNPVAEALLGLTRDGIEGQSYADIMNGLGDRDLLEHVIRTGRSVLDRPRTHTDADGAEVTVLASVAPILSHDGSILGAVEVLRDVTEMRRLEERANCQKRMAALGEMAASVAHEIRNPLGTIEGFARLLKRDLAEQPNHLRLAGKIVEGVQNLNYVITNLLTYARPASLQYESVSVSQLLADAAEVLRDRAQRCQVRLAIGMGDPSLTFEADARQCRQVILNLGLNAIEACEGLDEAASRRGEVVITAARDGAWLVLSFSDTGCGINKADQARIFDPFFTHKEGGTGLGLSLCHKIISAHGGTVSVENRADGGSLFQVRMPMARAAKAQPEYSTITTINTMSEAA